RIADLREAIRRSNCQSASFLGRLFWTFLKETRRRRLVNSLENLDAALAPLGFQRTHDSSPEQTLLRGVEFLDALKAASAYQATLRVLSSTPDTGALAAQVANQTRVLAERSAEAWNSWTALLPDRLNEHDRAALGDYAAILRTISKADEEGGTISKQ